MTMHILNRKKPMLIAVTVLSLSVLMGWTLPSLACDHDYVSSGNGGSLLTEESYDRLLQQLQESRFPYSTKLQEEITRHLAYQTEDLAINERKGVLQALCGGGDLGGRVLDKGDRLFGTFGNTFSPEDLAGLLEGKCQQEELSKPKIPYYSGGSNESAGYNPAPRNQRKRPLGGFGDSNNNNNPPFPAELPFGPGVTVPEAGGPNSNEDIKGLEDVFAAMQQEPHLLMKASIPNNLAEPDLAKLVETHQDLLTLNPEEIDDKTKNQLNDAVSALTIALEKANPVNSFYGKAQHMLEQLQRKQDEFSMLEALTLSMMNN